MRVASALAFACLLIAARPAAARYTPPTFAELVFESPVVVVGRIETLREGDYDLRVEQAIAGAQGAETLRVRRFENWTCGRRARPYEEGQRFVAFLTRDGDRLCSVGGGCEGDVILDGARALGSVRPEALWATRGEAIEETRFVSAVRALVTGYREVGAPEYVEAWRGLLRHEDPIVVAAAMERLDAEAVVNPRPASAFADDVVAAVAHPERGLRLYAASSLGPWLGRAERDAAAKRFAAPDPAHPELRPAAALARMKLDPFDPDRHAALIRVLADANVPLDERVAAAEAVASPRSRVPRDVPLAPIDPVARDAVVSIDDPTLLVRLCEYLANLRNRFPSYSKLNAEAVRAEWLRVLDAPPAEQPADARSVVPDEDAFLSPVERTVLVPRDAENRPLLAKLVRTTRRARNAKRAGDPAAALDAYRDVLSAAPFVDDAQRKVLLALGVDLDEVGREGRALLPEEK
jgi:hypothetical protein